MNLIIKLSLLALFCGCSSNPTGADRTALQKLNGASYESSNNLGIVTELSLLRNVTGQVYCGQNLSQIPAKLAEIKLTQGQQTIGTTTSNLVGQFLLSVKVSKQTFYDLQITAPCGNYKTRVLWENDTLKLNDIFLGK